VLSKQSKFVFMALLYFSNIACDSGDHTCNNENYVQDVVAFTTIIDSTCVPTPIETSDFVHLDIRNDWELFGYNNSLIACDSLGIYITTLGANSFHGVSSFLWDGTSQWTLEDSVIVGDTQLLSSIGNSPAWAINTWDDKLILGYWWFTIELDKSGAAPGARTNLSFESSLSESTLKPDELYEIKDKFVFVWHLKNNMPSSVLSFTDEEYNCLWELSFFESNSEYQLLRITNAQDTLHLLNMASLPFRPAFSVACTDSTIFIAPDWLDAILEIDTEGNIIRRLTGNHIARNEREVLVSIDTPRYARSVICQMQYLGDGLLAVLYGPACFETDSSEVWCIDLNTGNYGILPFSKSIVTFAATMENIVVSSCLFLPDSSTGFCSLESTQVSTASWDLSPLIIPLNN